MIRLCVTQGLEQAPTRCSPFFHQVPGGAGTGMHESLPSYIERLAQKHGIANGPFFLNEVHPQPVPSSGSLLGRHSRGLLLGTGYVAEIAEIVALRAAEPSVAGLIHPKLSRYIGWYKDGRPHTAWCPVCLADWLSGEGLVYRPLLWAIQSVRCCPKHHIMLSDRCPGCSSHFYHLPTKRWTVYCSECGQPLFAANGSQLNSAVSQPSSYDVFAATSVLELLRWGLNCSEEFPTDFFAKNIELALGGLGGEYVMSERMGLSRPVLHRWRQGHRRPVLPALIRLSYCFDLPLHHWITKIIPSSILAEPKRGPAEHSILYRRHPVRSRVSKAVRVYLSKPPDPPLSMSKLAKAIGTSTYKMYRTCPDLVARVVALYAAHRSRLKVKRQAQRVQLVRNAIAQLSDAGRPVTRNAVILLLTAQGVTCSWLLKEVFRREAEKNSRDVASD